MKTETCETMLDTVAFFHYASKLLREEMENTLDAFASDETLTVEEYCKYSIKVLHMNYYLNSLIEAIVDIMNVIGIKVVLEYAEKNMGVKQ